MSKDRMKDRINAEIDRLLAMVDVDTRDKIISELKYQPKEKDFEIGKRNKIILESKSELKEKYDEIERHTGKLRCAEQHIEKLECELKEKEAEIAKYVNRWEYYDQIIKKILTFE